MADIKVIIPMAGIGKRFAPLTHHRPKPLLRLTDQRLLDHVLDIFQPLEETYTLQYVFIIGYLGEQIKEYMQNAHPKKNVAYYEQKQLGGQSHAVYLAKDAVSGPILLTYCDTITATDFSTLKSDSRDGIVWVHHVNDPRRHGVAVMDSGNLVKKLVEKPNTTEHTWALTGLCYFPDGKKLIEAIETQLERGTSINNEYYLADAINILLENGAHIRAERALQWLDSGTPEAILETNAYLLQHSWESHPESAVDPSNIFIDPVYVHESAQIRDSIIGPNVSIGANCTIHRSIIKNTIVDSESNITDVSLDYSLIGQACSISGSRKRLLAADREEIAYAGDETIPPRGDLS
jgi:glucose-1-phosphate thymidylyltransferase